MLRKLSLAIQLTLFLSFLPAGFDVLDLQAGEKFRGTAANGPMGKSPGVHRWFEEGEDKMLRVEGPLLHSVGATTANIEWWSSRPAVFRVNWGETPELGNSQTLLRAFAYHPTNPLEKFNTFSLNGLEPDTRYYFQVEFVRFENGEDASSVQLDEDITSFSTLPDHREPRTLHVSPRGDNDRSGRSREEAWRSINHAADQVRPGDTVLIGEGVYTEKIRIRVTGDEELPITFKAKAGEKVVLDGAGKQLQGVFHVFNNKDYLRFDGFYMRDFGRGPTGAFGLIRSKNIRITRCFHDGREPGYDPELLTASSVDNLVVKNCVTLRGWDGIGLRNVTNVLIENNVFVQPNIRTIPGSFPDREQVRIKNNILTDNLASKRNAFLVREGTLLENNCFWLRFPEEERSVFGGGSGGRSLKSYNEEFTVEEENFVANPRFVALEEDEEDTPTNGFFDGAILRKGNDFPDFFTTHPDLIERGIGLIPEDFDDFHFHINLKDNDQ